MLPTEKSGLEFEFSMEKEATPIPEDPPFKILLVGDYSGRENLAKSTKAALPIAKPIEIDRDTFEDVLKRLNVSLRLDLQEPANEKLVLNFREFDDFDPDNLFKKVSLFSDLRSLRKRLLNPETYDDARNEIESWLDSERADDDLPDTANNEPDDDGEELEGTGNLLDDILGQTKTDATVYKQQTNSLLGDFIREVVATHLVETDEAEQAKLLAIVDSSTGDLMRTILHHPQFKALEAAWRGLYYLIKRAETGTDLKIFLLDISKTELQEDLKSGGDLSDTLLYKTMVTDTVKTPGGVPWAVVCGNYEFDLDVEDSAALIRLAKLANTARAPFISHIKPKMLGIDSFADESDDSAWNYKDESQAGKLWTLLRTIPEAVSLGLAVPKFLGRLPYGAETNPSEVFDFEEFTEDFGHDEYLWINPSFACALLLAQSFSEYGWEMGQNLYLELEGLPVHLYSANEEIITKPCAEVVLTHHACDVLIEQGLMPLISYRDTDRVRLGGFHSVSFPAKALNGRWG